MKTKYFYSYVGETLNNKKVYGNGIVTMYNIMSYDDIKSLQDFLCESNGCNFVTILFYKEI
jgi:hypothetical protein